MRNGVGDPALAGLGRYGVTKGSRSKRANCSLRFTAGSLKALTRARRQVAILERHSLKRRASQDEEAPTDERSGLSLPNHLVPPCAWDGGVNGSVLGKPQAIICSAIRLSAECASQTNAWKTTFNIARLVPPRAISREVLKRGTGAGLNQYRAALGRYAWD